MNSNANTQENSNKEYIPPQLILELELETHAGSPLGLPDGLDIFGDQ